MAGQQPRDLLGRALAEAAALRAANPAYASIVLRNLPFSVDSDGELVRMLAFLHEKEHAAGRGVIVAARAVIDPGFPARHRRLQLGLGAHSDRMMGKAASEALAAAPVGADAETSPPASASGDHGDSDHHDSAAVGGAGAGAAPSAAASDHPFDAGATKPLPFVGAAAPAADDDADNHCRDERDPCSQRYRGVATFVTAEHAARAVEVLHSMRLPDSSGVHYYHRAGATGRYQHSSVEPPSSVAAATARAGATAALAAAVARSASEEAAAVESDSQACELCRLHVELVDDSDSPPVPALAGSREARPRPLPVLSHWRPPVAGAAGGQAEAPQAPQAVAGRDYVAVIVHGFPSDLDAALLAEICGVVVPPLSVVVQAFPVRGLRLAVDDDAAAAGEDGSDADADEAHRDAADAAANADAQANADAGEGPMPDGHPRAGTARVFAAFASAADAHRLAATLDGTQYDAYGDGRVYPRRARVHVGDPPVWAVAGVPDVAPVDEWD